MDLLESDLQYDVIFVNACENCLNKLDLVYVFPDWDYYRMILTFDCV